MTTTGKLPPYRRDPETEPGPVVVPSSPTWPVYERSSLVLQESAFGSYIEDDTNAVLNTNNQPNIDAKGSFVWFTYRSTKALGDGVVKIRGRRLEDDGDREGSPFEQSFDMSEATDGDVFVSDARLADNCGLLVNAQGGFDGTVDYGTVSPEKFGGALTTLWGASVQFEPIEQLIENWLVAWEIQAFRKGAGGGLSPLVAKRTFRHSDSPFKRAVHGRPGYDQHLDLDEMFSGDPNEGVIVSVGVKAASVKLQLYIS